MISTNKKTLCYCITLTFVSSFRTIGIGGWDNARRLRS